MANRSTSNKQGEVPQPSPSSPEPVPNTVKRNPGETKPIDTTPTSEPLVEKPTPNG